MSARVQDHVLYLGDNGMCLCGEHLGMTAKHTGRDLSGQPIVAVTLDMAREAHAQGVPLRCERPRCERTPSLLVETVR